MKKLFREINPEINQSPLEDEDTHHYTHMFWGYNYHFDLSKS